MTKKVTSAGVQPNISATALDPLALAILTELPRYRSGDAVAIIDVISTWGERGHADHDIQAALQQLWDMQLVLTDDEASPPIHPRYSILFSSPTGDAVLIGP